MISCGNSWNSYLTHLKEHLEKQLAETTEGTAGEQLALQLGLFVTRQLSAKV